MNKKTFNSCKNVNQKVLFLLENYPKVRDCDNELVAHYIFNEIGQEAINEMTALELLSKISHRIVPSFETMRRARIRVQNKFEHLRGDNFGKRKKRKKITYFKVVNTD